MRIAQMGHTDIKTTKQFYEFDRETNAEKAQKLGEIEELRLLFEDIFFVPPTVLENLPFRGAVPCGTRKFSPPRIERNCLFGGLSRPAQENSALRIERNCLFVGQSRAAQRNLSPPD